MEQDPRIIRIIPINRLLAIEALRLAEHEPRELILPLHRRVDRYLPDQVPRALGVRKMRWFGLAGRTEPPHEELLDLHERGKPHLQHRELGVELGEHVRGAALRARDDIEDYVDRADDVQLDDRAPRGSFGAECLGKRVSSDIGR